jgi:hypothetical protein
MASELDNAIVNLPRAAEETYFRRHAEYLRVRIGHNIEMMESLRVLLLRVAEVTRHAHRTAGVP